MTDQEQTRRDLGWVHATGIVVGAIIGVGVFITPAKVARIAGAPLEALGLWALGGLIALAGALSLAEVGARFPASGGQLLALKSTLGRFPAFLYGWSLLVAIQTGVLVIISFFGAQNLAVALGADWNDAMISLVATLMLVSLLVANLLGAKQGAAVQTSTSVLKLLTLAALVVLGSLVAAGWIDSESVTTQPVESTGPSPFWLTGLAAVLFSYGGFHQLTWVGGEVKDASRTVPRAIALGIAIVITSYLLANLAYFLLLPYDTLVSSQTLAADAVGTVFPGWGRQAVAAALCLSAYGIANASLLTAPRVYFALGREGLFFPGFGRLHPGSGVPHIAITLQCGLALLLLWAVGPQAMDQLVTGVVFVDWTFHILTCIGLILLYRRGGSGEAISYKTPLMPWTPLVFVVGAAAGLGATFLDAEAARASWLGLGVLALGFPAYLIVRNLHR